MTYYIFNIREDMINMSNLFWDLVRKIVFLKTGYTLYAYNQNNEYTSYTCSGFPSYYEVTKWKVTQTKKGHFSKNIIIVCWKKGLATIAKIMTFKNQASECMCSDY